MKKLSQVGCVWRRTWGFSLVTDLTTHTRQWRVKRIAAHKVCRRQNYRFIETWNKNKKTPLTYRMGDVYDDYIYIGVIGAPIMEERPERSVMKICVPQYSRYLITRWSPHPPPNYRHIKVPSKRNVKFPTSYNYK